MREAVARRLREWARRAGERLLAWEEAALRATPPPAGRSLPLWAALALAAGVFLAATVAGSAVGYRYFWGQWRPVGRWDREIGEWSQAVRRFPGEASYWTNLAYAYFEKGEYARAEEAIREARRLAPGDPEAAYVAGLVLYRRGDYPRAEEVFARLAAEFPRNPLPVYQLAATYVAEGRHREAVERLTWIIAELDPTLADAYALRGRAYAALGEKERAKEDFRRALRMDPALEEARAGLVGLGVPAGDLPPAHGGIAVRRLPAGWFWWWR